MNGRTLVCILITISALISSQAVFATKILLRGGSQFPPGEIIGIENNTAVVKSAYGNLSAEFSKIDTMLFDEKADPNEPGIQFRNGDFITGEIDSLKNNILTIKMKYGLYIINDIDSVKSVNFLKNSDDFVYSQNKKEGLLFHLNGYESIYGNLLAIENSTMVVESRYGVLKIGADEIEQIQFPETAKAYSVNPIILFKNKNRVHGKPIYFKKNEFRIRTDFGEMIVSNMSAFANIVLGENRKISETIRGNFLIEQTVELGGWKVSSDKTSWKSVSLPHTGWGCDNCTRFYRTEITGKPTKIRFRWASDNKARLWFNNSVIFDDYWLPNYCGDKYGSGAICCYNTETCISGLSISNWYDVALSKKLLENLTNENVFIWEVYEEWGGEGFHTEMEVTYY